MTDDFIHQNLNYIMKKSCWKLLSAYMLQLLALQLFTFYSFNLEFVKLNYPWKSISPQIQVPYGNKIFVLFF